jgi:hypothetical protein
MQMTDNVSWGGHEEFLSLFLLLVWRAIKFTFLIDKLTTYIYLYNILSLSSGPPLPSIRPVIRPSKFLIPEEEEEGGGQMAASADYPSSLKFQIKKEENNLLINK